MEMKKVLELSFVKSVVAVAALACVFVACSDSSTESKKDEMSTVSSRQDLPRCTTTNEKEAFLVEDEDVVVACYNREWEVVDDTTVTFAEDPVFDTTAVDTNKTDDPEENVWGDDDFDKKKDTVSSGADTNKAPVYVFTSVGLSGTIEMGAFAQGSKVNVTELDSAKLAETKIFYEGSVTANGAYSITGMNFMQKNVRISASGVYFDALTGTTSTLPVTLSAIASVGDTTPIVLNILTTLQSARVVALVKKGEKSVAKAMEKATSEIWKTFGIDAKDFESVERISYKNGKESGAALVALTSLLQVETANFPERFDALVKAFAEKGSWSDEKTRASIADWALSEDVADGFVGFRTKQELQLGKLPTIEKYFKNFYQEELGLKTCSSKNDGEIAFVNNKNSKFYAKDYSDVTKTLDRFACDVSSDGWRLAQDFEKDTYKFEAGKDGDIREGQVNKSNFYVFNGTTWKKVTDRNLIIEKYVKSSNVKEFVDIQEAFEGTQDDENVIILLRHAERTDNTGKDGLLTDEGIEHSKDVGEKLTKFKDAFRLGGSEFVRAHQTVENIAKGRIKGDKSIKQDTVVKDTLPELNDDWYILDKDLEKKAESESGGGWEAVSKYAYTGAFATGASPAFYPLKERSLLLIDSLVKRYSAGTDRFVLLSSHDKLMMPLVAYISDFNINLKKYDGGSWINYLAGVAIFYKKDGGMRFVVVKGLKSGTM